MTGNYRFWVAAFDGFRFVGNFVVENLLSFGKLAAIGSAIELPFGEQGPSFWVVERPFIPEELVESGNAPFAHRFACACD